MGMLSTCLRRRVVASLYDKLGRFVSIGWNGAPIMARKCTDTGICPRSGVESGEALDRCRAVHAEVRAILNAVQYRSSLKGFRMDVSVSPCRACAAIIAESGISHVRYIRRYGDGDGIALLEECGVTVEQVENFEGADDGCQV